MSCPLGTSDKSKNATCRQFTPHNVLHGASNTVGRSKSPLISDKRPYTDISPAVLQAANMNPVNINVTRCSDCLVCSGWNAVRCCQKNPQKLHKQTKIVWIERQFSRLDERWMLSLKYSSCCLFSNNLNHKGVKKNTLIFTPTHSFRVTD